MSVRFPAVAGLFYPDDPRELGTAVRQYLAEAEVGTSGAAWPRPKALIAPHAGYVYSGPVAGSAYRLLVEDCQGFSKVVLLGPSHRVGFRGLALAEADTFTTPLGPVTVDAELRGAAAAFDWVGVRDDAHAAEHSLEVHLPFLQTILPAATVLPLVVGAASPLEVAAVLEAVGRGSDTLIVVSTDLSHYLDYRTAQRVDAETTGLIEARSETIEPEQACGCRPLNGLLHFAREAGLQVQALDVRNSGDTAGSRDRVVGYGAYTVH